MIRTGFLGRIAFVKILYTERFLRYIYTLDSVPAISTVTVCLLCQWCYVDNRATRKWSSRFLGEEGSWGGGEVDSKIHLHP